MDYLFKTLDLGVALQTLAVLKSAGIGDPSNMLGEPILDATGTLIARATKGRPPATYVDFQGTTVTIPTAGDPAYWYISIRADILPADIPFNPATYGLLPCDPTENASVLGVWA